MKIKIISLKEFEEFIKMPWEKRWNETTTEEDYRELKERKESLLLGETEKK